MRLLLKSIRTALGQACDKELLIEHSDISLIGVERNNDAVHKSNFFENGCTNLRLHLFTETSKEAMCVVLYLENQAP